MHLGLDYDGCFPVFVRVTKARKHEVKIAQKPAFPAGGVIAFDMGCIDYSWLYMLQGADIQLNGLFIAGLKIV